MSDLLSALLSAIIASCVLPRGESRRRPVGCQEEGGLETEGRGGPCRRGGGASSAKPGGGGRWGGLRFRRAQKGVPTWQRHCVIPSAGQVVPRAAQNS